MINAIIRILFDELLVLIEIGIALVQHTHSRMNGPTGVKGTADFTTKYVDDYDEKKNQKKRCNFRKGLEKMLVLASHQNKNSCDTRCADRYAKKNKNTRRIVDRRDNAESNAEERYSNKIEEEARRDRC